MINTIYTIGMTSLSNAQVAVNNTSTNIANADTEGYRRTEAVFETNPTTTSGGVTVGCGAGIAEIQASVNVYIEAQYLASLGLLSTQNYSYDYISQAESLFDQGEDSGLSASLSEFWLSWESLAADPTSEAVRQDVLGSTETLAYALQSAASALEDMQLTLEEELKDQVQEANDLIVDIAALNDRIVSQPDNLELVNERDLKIQGLAALVDVTVSQEDNGQTSVFTAGGLPLVQGGTHNELVCTKPRVAESLLPGSTYDGELNFTGESGEELLLEFVSSGQDGVAQFRVSLDGGQTWEADEYGNTLLYTASDASDSVVVEGVEIWFDGTGEHGIGDRYTVLAKSGVAWSPDEGDTLVNVNPLDDGSGTVSQNRLSSGSITGLIEARDEVILPLCQDLDELAEALVWETNLAHSQGAGLEHHTYLSGSYAAGNTTVPLSDSDLHFADKLQSGDLSFVTYEADGNVSTQALVAIDPDADSLDAVAADINAAFAGELTATVNADGTLSLQAASDMSFEVAGDETGVLAVLGLNTFFTGTDADSIAISSVLDDAAHVNCQVVEADGSVSSGSNETAQALANLATETVIVDGTEVSLSEALAIMVSDVGSAARTAELEQAYCLGSVTFYESEIASVSGVNVDEELINLTKYQQMYQAAAQIIQTAQAMFNTILDMT